MDDAHSSQASDLQLRAIIWRKTEDVAIPYEATVGNLRLSLRANDAPNEAHYSLLINGGHVADLDEWPEHWVR